MTRINSILRRLGVLSAALLLALCCTVTAAAERTGTLTLQLTDETGVPAPELQVRLYRVGQPDGTLTPDFAAADIAPGDLLSQQQSAQNAVTLATLASTKKLTGADLTADAHGEARFTGLSQGVYLVLCPPGQPLTFPAFLVRIPLTVNGAAVYDVVSRPKAGPPADPAPTPTPAPDGALPQTGADPLPLLFLLAGGCLLVILGTADILHSRREHDA